MPLKELLPRKSKLYGFHTPHAAVRTDGMLVNHRTGEIFKPVTRVKQEFVSQCDINNIVKSFQLTGQISHISAKAAQGAYVDLPSDLDFQNSMNIVIQAEQAFASLPAKVRDRFGHNPEEFLAFVQDPENADELIKLGLRNPPPRRAQEPATGSGGAGGPPPAPTPESAPAATPGGSNPPSGGPAR